MSRYAVSVLLLVASSNVAFAQSDKENRIRELRNEIATLEKKLDALKKELGTLQNDFAKYEKVAIDPNSNGGRLSLKVGAKGIFGNESYRVRVVDGITSRIRIGEFEFLAVGASTRFLNDDNVVTMRGVWEVTGTKMYLGKTMHVVQARYKASIVVK
jgi:hypothetical protein